MGVAICFAGRLITAAYINEVVHAAIDFASSYGWPAYPFEDRDSTLHREIDGKDVTYRGPTRGVRLQPHPDCDPLWLQFDRDLYVDDFCKTQFAGAETHRRVVQLLRMIEPLFIKLDVCDDAEFWDTRDFGLLQRHIAHVDALIADACADGSHTGPTRLANGRMIDLTAQDSRDLD
jgi:hypothetical protein